MIENILYFDNFDEKNNFKILSPLKKIELILKLK